MFKELKPPGDMNGHIYMYIGLTIPAFTISEKKSGTHEKYFVCTCNEFSELQTNCSSSLLQMRTLFVGLQLHLKKNDTPPKHLRVWGFNRGVIEIVDKT